MRGVTRLLLSALSSTSRLVIFTYHRVLPMADPLLPGEPTREHLRRHAQFMARYLNVMPLAEGVERLFDGSLPARAACITFDDGYRNNYELAAPILDEHGLTATFFIATGAVDTGAMFNDIVIEAVRRAPARLDLASFDLGTWDCGSPSARLRTVGLLLEQIKYRPHDERQVLCREIFRSVTREPPPDMMMSPEMIRDLARRGYEIGGHTISHPILANLDPCRARQEIAGCRDWLTEVTGAPPITFAYPNGRPGVDFRPEHGAMLEELGFRCAVSTEWSVATPAASRYALPRLTPWELTESGWVKRMLKSYGRSRLDEAGRRLRRQA